MTALHYLPGILALLSFCSAREGWTFPTREPVAGKILIKTGTYMKDGVQHPNVVFESRNCSAAALGTFMGPAKPAGKAKSNWLIQHEHDLWHFNYADGMVPYDCPLEFRVFLNPEEINPDKVQIRECVVGRSTETLTKAWTFEFKNDPSYLSHCKKRESDDEVWVTCGKEGDVLNPEATCRDW